MNVKLPKNETRSPEELRAAYRIETQLANRLRNAPKEERGSLYPSLYEELLCRVPNHPQVSRTRTPAQKRTTVHRQLAFLRPFLKEEMSVLEVGAGDCALAFRLAKQVKKVYALEVNSEVLPEGPVGSKFESILSDGISIPLPPESVDIVYSNQVMEHLHPEDAEDQLLNIYRTLKPGGIYVCVTPNRASGPHDISRYFDTEAKGLHLKEYFASELATLFARTGFSRTRLYVGGHGVYLPCPARPILTAERITAKLPGTIRQSILFGGLLGVRIVGWK